LLLIYLKDLDDYVFVKSIADDTKVFSVVSNANNIDRLQQGVRNLCRWSQEEVTEERDFGVIMYSDLKCSSLCIKAVNTANKVLGMINRTFSVREKYIICSYISHWLDHIWSTVSRHGGHIIRNI